MADGRLVCKGSSLFLKQAFRVGYNLTCVRSGVDGEMGTGGSKSSSGREGTQRIGSTQSIRGLVQKHVPDAQVEIDGARDVRFRLPLDSQS